MRISKILAMVVVVLALSGFALQADDLNLTNITYNPIPAGFNAGGGSFGGAILDGVALPWVYCVQLHTTVSMADYPDTIVDTTGVIQNTDGALHPNLAAAERIAYLLGQYAWGADVEHQVALQAAIWNAEGYGVLTGGTGNEQTYYSAMLLNAGLGNVADYRWLTPGIGTNHEFQGLVTAPDGGMTLMLLGGVLVGLETLRRKHRV